MSNSFNDKKTKFIIDFAYISIIIIVIYIIFKYLLGIFMPFILAIILTFIVEPAIKFLLKKTGLPRSVCSSICISLFIIILVSLLTLMLMILFKQLDDLLSLFPRLLKNISDMIDDIQFKNNKSILDKAIIYFKDNILSMDINSLNNSDFINSVIIYLANILSSFPKILMTVIVTFVFSVFFSSSYPNICELIKKRFPPNRRLIISNIKKSVFTILGKYLKSYTLLMLITFLELYISFSVFRIRPSFTLALLISVIDVLPVFGVGTVMIPWGIVLFICGDYTMAAVILSIYGVITVIRQIIEPKIIGKSIGLSPVVTLPVMFVGLSLFGLIGLFAGPMVATIIYDLHQKGLISLWNKH